MLREGQGRAGGSGMPGFVMPEETPCQDGAAEPRWTEADVERAIAAAERAGLPTYRVEIAPDGTIAIVVGAPPEAAKTPAKRDR